MLSEEIILVTGATSGFGEAIARRVAKEGAKVYITGRREGRLNHLANEINATPLVFDVRDKEAVFENLSPLKDVTVLVNNAGLARGVKPAPDASLGDWEEMVDTNIKGVIYCTQALLLQMKEQNRGHILSIGSIAGNWPYKGGNVYGGTKAFVKQFMLNLRTDLQGSAIRVTNIEPGLAETEFSLVRFHGDAEKAKEIYKGTEPLKAEDVAEAVSWTISQPKHVNVNFMEIMPVCQTNGGFSIHRE